MAETSGRNAEEIARRTAELELRLAANPYDTVAALERLLLLAADGRTVDATARFDTLKPFLGATSHAWLEDIVAGRVPVRFVAAHYLVGDLEGTAAFVTQASAVVASIAGALETERAVLAFREVPSARSPYAVRLANGCGLVIAARDVFESATDALLAHEITHCTVASGHAFFDEGLATCFERRHSPRPSASLPPIEGMPSLRAIVQQGEVLWATSDHARVEWVYDLGSRVMSWLLARHGGRRIYDFVAGLGVSVVRRTVATDFERCFDLSIEALEQELRGTAPHKDSSSSGPGGDHALAEEVRVAYFSADMSTLERLGRELEGACGPNASAEIVEALLRCRSMLAIYGDDPDGRDRGETIALIERFARLRPDAPETAAFQAIRATLEMTAALSLASRQQLCDEAVAMLEDGLARHPENIDLLLVSGQLTYNMAAAMGGDAERARKYFVAAARDRRYGAIIGRRFVNRDQARVG